jgi:hypothetical protein
VYVYVCVYVCIYVYVDMYLCMCVCVCVCVCVWFGGGRATPRNYTATALATSSHCGSCALALSTLSVLATTLRSRFVILPLPDSYLCRWHVLVQMLVVDTCTFLMHVVEHVVPRIYIPSHKPHHVWINPKMFDAFNGSPLDTFGLILIPLFMTCHICNFVNTWEFIAFGTIYANQFTLIHW